MSLTQSVTAQEKSKEGNDSITSKTILDSTAKKSRISKVVLLPPPKEWQRKIAIESLLKMTGQKITYCIFFYGSKYSKKSGNTFLYFGGNYPDQFLTVLIKGKDKGKFEIPPEVKFVNKEVCIKGVVLNSNGTPQIIVNNPKQLKVVFTSPYPLK